MHWQLPMAASTMQPAQCIGSCQWQPAQCSQHSATGTTTAAYAANKVHCVGPNNSLTTAVAMQPAKCSWLAQLQPAQGSQQNALAAANGRQHNATNRQLPMQPTKCMNFQIFRFRFSESNLLNNQILYPSYLFDQIMLVMVSAAVLQKVGINIAQLGKQIGYFCPPPAIFSILSTMGQPQWDM
jgi:hypothetical protein